MKITYDNYLTKIFGSIPISLVRHDTSPNGYPLCIVMYLDKLPKNKGEFAKDAGNYLYRVYNIVCEPIPEYRGRGKKTTIRFFMNWDQAKPFVRKIHQYHRLYPSNFDNFIPLSFISMHIQA